VSGSVYLDACMIIDLVEGAPDLQRRLRSAIRGRTLVSSELARLESRIGALREQRAVHLATYRNLFENCEMQSLDRAVFDLAADLRVRHRLKTPDALHLAAALHAGCGELWTNDERLVAAAKSHLEIVTLDRLAEGPGPQATSTDDRPDP
jgi:predicted nucleic acid-binding protein